MPEIDRLPESRSLKWRIAQTLEYQWWQNYLRKRESNAYLQWKLAYWQDILKKLQPCLGHPENLDILDAGCGPAGIFMALPANRVDALDPLLDKYKAFPHFRPEQYPFVRFRHLPIEALEEKGKYDLVFCMNAINHVNDIRCCYDKLSASLKPGGLIVVSTDAHRSRLLKKIFQWLPGDLLHPVQLDIREYNNFLLQRNFSILATILIKREKIFDYYITVAQKQ